MKLSQTELVVVGLLIAYTAFFSHPPPSHIKDFLSSPVGHAVFLLGIVYITVYKSLIIGIFAGIAYVMTAANTTEYLDAKEQKPKAEKPAEAKADTKKGKKTSTNNGPQTDFAQGKDKSKQWYDGDFNGLDDD